MIDLSYYIKVSTSPSGCNSYDAEQFKCDKYLDCDSCLEDKIKEHDKHVIEQYKADTNIKDTIRDIHDNVAREMYCKGIDDMVKNLISNSRTEIIDEKLMLIVTEERIKTVANEMKKWLDS